MQVRRSRVRRNGKTYEYIQLVESYRRESDGMPMHRVVANLGRADELPAENIERALQAARSGKRVVLATEVKASHVARPVANLRYLDVAVLLELCRALGVDRLLRSVLPPGDADVDPAAVVMALAIQRCTDPGSTLYASRWFPRTALPELLGIARSRFNNTRLHRVLHELDKATPELMRRLPRHYVARDGAFAAMFLDVSDACFVGDGPELARRAKAKAGYVRQKIGIVLLCNDAGLPLQWDVVAGSQHDSVSMTALLETIAGSEWLGDAPVVMDRAMGKTAQIRELLNLKVRFLTALTSPEFEAYSTKIPHECVADLRPHDEEQRKSDIERAARAVEAAGMERVADNLFVMDLGIVERRTSSSSTSLENISPSNVASDAMRVCREVTSAVANGRFASYAAAGRSLGFGKSVTLKYRQLAMLPEDIQREILEGRTANCALADLIAVARAKDPQQQRKAFDELIALRPAREQRAHLVKRNTADHTDTMRPVRVRAAVYFNPERFVESRINAERRKQEVAGFVATLNEKLCKPGAKATAADVVAAVDRKLRELEFVDAFEVRVTERELAGRRVHHVDAKLKSAEWQRRRSHDGFSVLVAHPDLHQSAASLCRLYRAKDAVEKDFQIIKSVVELEPVRHRTTAKVRAHVTLCMLALLLERHLGRQVAKRCTAEAALEILSSCRINRYQSGGKRDVYVLTQPDEEQRRILRSLRLQHLADDEEVAQRIRRN